MKTKKIKKLVLNKETISNLSNFEQNMLIGGYDAGSMECATKFDTWCQKDSCFTCVTYPKPSCGCDGSDDCCGSETCYCPQGLYSV